MPTRTAQAQFSDSPFQQRTDFLLTSPGALKYGLYGAANPAQLGYIERPDFLFQFSDEGGFGSPQRYGGFLAFPGLGFSALYNDTGPSDFTAFSVGTGFGEAAGSFGFSYNWYGGDAELFGLQNHISVGSISRPSRYLSFGTVSSFATQERDYEVAAEVAVRPFGTPALALFGDYAVQKDVAVGKGTWSSGLAVEPFEGVRLTGRYLHDNGITAGLQFSFGGAGVQTQTHLDTGGGHRFNTYGIRLGQYDRTVLDNNPTPDRYLNLSLGGPLAYQTRRFFDDRRTLENVLSSIREAAEDPRIAGIAVNTTGMAISPTMVWEVRSELQRFREEGKKVLVYIERGGMNTLHLASVADYVVMDPQGGLSITGYSTTTTYLKDLLDYYGIGVDEFREFEYKSALESLARSEGSEADREQRQDLIDGYYELTRREVVAGTPLDEAGFDALIDNGLSLLPADLLEAGIVDSLARPTDLEDILKELEGRSISRTGRSSLLANQLPNDEYWGEKPQVAILYAIGGTQTEGGIRARILADAIRSARKNERVKAIILRADSPGGDPLASDLVAEEMKKAMDEKPVIVSMGNVAASGGYWISMYSDAIVVAPNTITGSIGVISGWFYDDGLSDRLRLNYRTIARGESADLMGGPTLPLIGLTLPGRNLTEEEREGLISRMITLYDEFIAKVAEGRDMDEDEVREVAEGRVWTGRQAIENGLADETGNLMFALDMALEQAGMQPEEPFELVQGPELAPFSLADILPLPGLLESAFAGGQEKQSREDDMVAYLKMMMEQNGYPSVVLPMEEYQLLYQLMR
ncbi:MAG: S49 family peptidase [Cyclonatronaceae bacterium]